MAAYERNVEGQRGPWIVTSDGLKSPERTLEDSSPACCGVVMIAPPSGYYCTKTIHTPKLVAAVLYCLGCGESYCLKCCRYCI